MIPIMLDEWLIETGSMNYAYGHGVAEWSFVVVPGKAAVMLAIAMLAATIAVLLRAVRKSCPVSLRLAASVGAAGGTLVAGLASMTITWVVCCAAPTWVVGLAVLGMSVTTAFALQPFGGWLALLGIALLSMIALALASLRLEGAPDIAATAIPTQFAGAPS
jgi:hypothetical protein